MCSELDRLEGMIGQVDELAVDMRRELTMPGKVCAAPGCAKRIESGQCYCERHKKQKAKLTGSRQYDKRRGSAHQRGYTSKWQRYRETYLAEHPLCVVCDTAGLTTPSEEVDHIVPVSGPYDPLFWKPSNHQALCKSCHSSKTARENGGLGNQKQLGGGQ